MDLEKMLREIGGSNNTVRKPVCIMKDHLDILRSYNMYHDDQREILEEMEKIGNVMAVKRSEYFDTLTSQLSEKGLITKAHIDSNRGIHIEDGVIFFTFEHNKD